jgi:hypothetical protein
VSTSAIDTCRDVKIRTENLTEVPNEFLPLIQVPPMIQNKTEVLNLKSRKTQVPIGYLTKKKNSKILPRVFITRVQVATCFTIHVANCTISYTRIYHALNTWPFTRV